MNPSTTIPETGLYADEAPGGLIVPPTSEQFHQGVEPEMTCPAPWWNYFNNLFTNTAIKARADMTALLLELNNLLTAYGYTPTIELSNQLATLFSRFISGDNNRGTLKLTTGSLNSILKSGFYQYTAGVTDFPSGLTSGMIIHTQFSDSDESAVQIALGTAAGSSWIRTKASNSWQAWSKIWTSSNDGTGSGLDADLIRGKDPSQFGAIGPDGWPQIKSPGVGIASYIGNSAKIPLMATSRPAIVSLGNYTIAIVYVETITNNVKIACYTWDGSDYTLLGSEHTITTRVGILYAAALTDEEIVINIIDASSVRTLEVYRVDKTDYSWTKVGNTTPIAGLGQIIKLHANALIGVISNSLVYLTWDGSSWTNVSSLAFTSPLIAKQTESTFTVINTSNSTIYTIRCIAGIFTVLSSGLFGTYSFLVIEGVGNNYLFITTSGTSGCIYFRVYDSVGAIWHMAPMESTMRWGNHPVAVACAMDNSNIAYFEYTTQTFFTLKCI